MKVLEKQKQKKSLKKISSSPPSKKENDAVTTTVEKSKINPALAKKKSVELQQRKKGSGDKSKITHYLNKISSLQIEAQKRLIEKSENNYKTQRWFLFWFQNFPAHNFS